MAGEAALVQLQHRRQQADRGRRRRGCKRLSPQPGQSRGSSTSGGRGRARTRHAWAAVGQPPPFSYKAQPPCPAPPRPAPPRPERRDFQRAAHTRVGWGALRVLHLTCTRGQAGPHTGWALAPALAGSARHTLLTASRAFTIRVVGMVSRPRKNVVTVAATAITAPSCLIGEAWCGGSNG
jgi:hypothetical protein